MLVETLQAEQRQVQWAHGISHPLEQHTIHLVCHCPVNDANVVCDCIAGFLESMLGFAVLVAGTAIAGEESILAGKDCKTLLVPRKSEYSVFHIPSRRTTMETRRMR